MQNNRLLALLMCLFFFNLIQAQDRESTALPNVVVLDEPLKIPGLDRSRTLRIYLPPGYNQSQKSYPVMYMHDGQNLFDDATSFVGEWGIDERMNALAASDDLELIIVGVDNGQEHRNTELSPWKNERLGPPEGDKYMEFLVKVVKPYVDEHYRTKPDRASTAIMGSSLGGLISHYGIYAYPEVFSKAGIFSPSYWVSEEVYTFTKENPVPKDTRLYLIVGEKEGPMMYKPMEKMHDFILAEGHPKGNISAKINPEGKHNEAFWRSEFQEAVKWLFKK